MDMTASTTGRPTPEAPGSGDAGGGPGAGIVAAAVAAGLGAAVLLVILLAPAVDPVWDQTFIAYRLSRGYPSFDEGIVSHLLVGLVNAVVPYAEPLSNTVVRSLAALLYVGAAGLLAWSVTGPARWWGYAAFLLLLITARFPFLWLSSELFAGAILMLFLWSFVRGRSIAVTGLFLVLFGLSKADLALPALLVGAYLALRPGAVPRWRRAAVLGGMAAVLVLPTFFFSTPYYAQFGGRAWVSFGQHYGELVRPHQLEPAPPGWGAWPRYLEAGFPGAESVVEAMLRHPRTYAHFIGLSGVESTIRLWSTRLLLLVPLAAFAFMAMRRSFRVVVLLLLTSLIPVVMLSFLHVRYQARFYPLVLFVVFAGLRDGGYVRKHERVLQVLLAALLLWQAWDLVPVLASGHWLPD